MKRPSKLLKSLRRTTDPRRRAARYEAQLALMRRDDDPIKWAEIQGALAVSLTEAAGDQVGPDEFNAAVKHYLAALSVYTREEHPKEWATTLRNSAHAHLRAAHAAPDASQFHVEAAIDDLTEATTIQPEAAPAVWVYAKSDLAAALCVAAQWRGPSAFMESAETYGEVLGVFNRVANSEYWAMLNQQYAAVLFASGDLSRIGDAIDASDRALEVVTRRRDPIWWAQLQVQLGALHRRCPVGDRSKHLERAKAALDAALSVFTPERHPADWRAAKDESLLIAVAMSFRDHDPKRWAALQVAMARELLGRTEGDRQEHIEGAVSACEAALDVLSADDSPRIWVVANYCLGDALLQRRAGDPDDNADRGIALLEEAQRRDDPPFDLDEWKAARAKLGLAYARRSRGDDATNRAKAVGMWLALLRMRDGNFPRKRHKYPNAVIDPDERQFAPLMAMRDGQRPLQLDPRWHVPVELECDARELQARLLEFFRSGRLPKRTRKERANLERERHSDAVNMIAYLQERRTARERTEAFFADTQSTGWPFVLFLRGYNNRIDRYPEGFVTVATMKLEMPDLAELVDSIAPMPVVWMANPIESYVVDITIGQRRAYEVGFRVESDLNWEEDVRKLMLAASFIVVDNTPSLTVNPFAFGEDRRRVMSSGVKAEIERLAELGRLEDTFFADVGAANTLTGRSDCRALDDEARNTMRAYDTPRPPPEPLPPAMCPWVGGTRRATMEREQVAVAELLERLDAAQRPVLGDVVLDVISWLFSYAVLLEQSEQVPGLLDRIPAARR